jgi:hypothetical protein
MKNLLLPALILGLSQPVLSQNNAVVIRDNAFIVINGGTNGTEAVVVVDQSHQNGIVTSGTGGNIITNGEFDYVKWNIGTSTGNYTVPFTTDVGLIKIPLSVNVTAGGTGSGYMALSTWDVSAGGGQFDNTPWPSDVTHMAGANGVPDNSDYAVDRFWVIDVTDPLGTGETYTGLPSPTFTFGYNTAAAETGDGNNLTVGLLGAQHFDPATDNWHGAGSGVGVATGIWGADNGAGLVSSVTPPSGEWFRTWTLSDFSSPLPVELATYDVVCKDEGVVVTWQTASEIYVDEFRIYKSFDGIDFELVGSLPAAGNSTQVTDYSYIDETLNVGDAIYSLVEVNENGEERELSTQIISGCWSDAGFEVFGSLEGEVVISWNSLTDGDYEVVLFDALGKQVDAPENINVSEGQNRFELTYDQLAFGTYMIQIYNHSESFVKKLVIR